MPLRGFLAAQQPETPSPRRGSGGVTWFAAAAALVVGILIGFTSGYRAGQDNSVSTALADALDPATASRRPESLPSDSTTTFSEAAVAEPQRVDEPVLGGSNGSDDVGQPHRNGLNVSAQKLPNVPVQNGSDAGRSQAAERSDRLERTAGSLNVVSRPAGAQVVLDGRVVGRTPLSIPDVTAGTHTVHLDLPGFNRWVTSVDVHSGARTRVAASLEQP